MTRRASWRGHLTIGGLSCGIGLYSAISAAEKISFNIINRKTGNRVERQFVDSETGKPVERDAQIRGYKLDDGDYVKVGDEELSALVPSGDKTLDVERFVACDAIDKLYFDRSYYLGPTDHGDTETLSLFARALSKKKVAALAEAVLFRRNRTLLIRPSGDTLVATTLNFDYEVRSATRAFQSLPDIKFDKEMLDLAGHIIETRMGRFDPADYTDRYNDALAELVQAKLHGRKLKKRAEPKHDNVLDLKEALRQSAEAGKKSRTKRTTGKSAAASGTSRRKAG
ncbi:Ku protein [Rhizobium halophytocola]|uniref:Non-homologous end joining protein Ku n=1 Tax=Rhizobium halophytocola TaxID=735519 RepID=A0ABS4DU99_9HYPH|nr:Ku protein [Rhizobium halophytocola]MBP1849256.1 DNA end-binding protein Ku [Rhizobium halophytocola]